MGWKVFVHAVRMVVDNLDVALRLSLVLSLVQIALQVFIFRNPEAAMVAGGATGPDAAVVGEVFLLSLLSLLATFWIAVGWHRFALEGELPAGWLPRWRPREIGAYFWRFLGIFLLIFAGLAVSMVIALALPALLGVLAFGLMGLASYVFFRVGLVLPAAAIGRRMTLRESWRATGEADKAVLGLALIVIAAQFLAGLPVMIDGDTGSVVSLVYSVVVNWMLTMFGIAVLTTLYGHVVEGRPLD